MNEAIVALQLANIFISSCLVEWLLPFYQFSPLCTSIVLKRTFERDTFNTSELAVCAVEMS